MLSLRRERVQLTSTSGTLPNVSSAKVAQVIYLANHVRIGVYGHNNFEVKLPNFEGLVQPEPGAGISLGWKKGNLSGARRGMPAASGHLGRRFPHCQRRFPRTA